MKDYEILKNYCKKIFLFGSGNYWYEDGAIGDDSSWYYQLYLWSLIFIYVLMTIFETMAVTIGDYPENETGDAITLAVSHTIVLLKIFSLLINKKLIRTTNRNMVEICEAYEDPTLMAEKYKYVKINVMGYFGIVYCTCLFYVVEGIRKVYAGSHFETVVTYPPSYVDESLFAGLIRVSTTIVLLIMMITMIVAVDTFTMAYLIMFKYKFITLRHYLERLSEDFYKMNDVNPRLAADKLTDGVVEGIIMHKELLRLAKDIDQAFGTVIALQLCLSSGSAVTLLLQIALTPMTFVAILKNILFVVALFFLLGLFLCNAGEITYQASLLPDALFYCGWHACVWQPPRRSVRRLVLLACAQAQQPLVMKAFKMIQLSYSTFLQVLRGTYSVFALFYAQTK
ncbi:putative odorant receptor 19b [Ostrinia furnacalis]|uniref:putative odorant receptor 19b n=1 Tax=Ostrinia furnacalis TaxID=93504 RepID=UPI00103B87F3|nr:putative odorant receptor 19b [Ostrinia furnacalis]